MKNNKFIVTSLASAMLVAGMAMPKALAVNASATEVRLTDSTIAIDLSRAEVQDSKVVFNRKSLADLVSAKYNTSLVSVIDANGKEVTSDDELVGTGSKVTLATGKLVTVVLYGDVNGDGIIDLVDAQRAYNNYHLTSLPANQYKAADVAVGEEDGTAVIDYVDAQRIFGFTSSNFNGSLVADIAKLPVEEKAPEYDVTVTVAGDYPYVNNGNDTDVKLKFELKKALDKDEEFTLELKGTLSANGTEATAKRKVKVPANTLKITAGGTAAQATETADEIKEWEDSESSGAALDLTTWANGIIKGTLKNSKGEIVSEFVIQKYSTTPKAANIVAERLTTYKYNFSLDTLSEYPLANVYYHRVDFQAGNSAAGTSKGIASAPTTMFTSGIKLPCVNGSLSREIEDTMTEGLASTLYFVLEDVYGNKSTSVEETIITADAGATKAVKATNVTSPALTTTKSSAEFTWTGVDAASYTVRMYYKENADSTPILVGEETKVKTTSTNGTTTNFGKNVVTKPGFYYAEVITEATATNKASDPVKSTEFEVKQMPSVKVSFDDSDMSNPKVKWDNTAYKDIDAADFDQLTFTVKRKDGKGIDNGEAVAAETTKTVKEKAITGLKAGVIYTVETTVKSKGGLGYIDSEPVESDAFFTLGAASVSSVENTTVTLSSVPIVKVNDTDAVYTVEALELVEGETNLNEGEKITVPGLKVTKEGNLVIPSLKAGARYRIRLQCTAADGSVATSNWIPSKTSYVRTLPEIINLTSKKTEEVASSGIWTNGTTELVINGTKYLSSEYGVSSTQFTSIINIVNALEETETKGDIITLDADNKNVEIEFIDDVTGTNARNFAAHLAGYNVTLKAHDVRKVLTINGAKDLILDSGLFDIDAVQNVGEPNVNEDVITCKNGADVTKAVTKSNKLKVLAGAKVRIDGIDVTPSIETLIDRASSKLNVYMTTDRNEITVNNTKGGALVVNFVSTTKPETTQLGEITINNTGDVTVTAQSGATDTGVVSSTMNITVTDGNVDVSKRNVTGGEKTITVHNTDTSTGHTVKGYAKNILPAEFVSKVTAFTSQAVEFDLSKVLDENDPETWTSITTPASLNPVTDAEEIKSFIKYLNDNFGGLIGKNVKISIDQTSTYLYNGYALITLTIKEDTKGNPLVITGLE